MFLPRPCSAYTTLNFCVGNHYGSYDPDGNFRYGAGWPASYGKIEDYANRQNVSARDACCACGGGWVDDNVGMLALTGHKCGALVDAAMAPGGVSMEMAKTDRYGDHVKYKVKGYEQDSFGRQIPKTCRAGSQLHAHGPIYDTQYRIIWLHNRVCVMNERRCRWFRQMGAELNLCTATCPPCHNDEYFFENNYESITSNLPKEFLHIEGCARIPVLVAAQTAFRAAMTPPATLNS